MDELISDAVKGSEDARSLLLSAGIQSMQRQAGYIPDTTDEQPPTQQEVAHLIFTYSLGGMLAPVKESIVLKNRLAMLLYHKTYEMLSFKESGVINSVHDFASLCPICDGGHKRRRCQCKNTGLVATRTIKALAQYIEEHHAGKYTFPPYELDKKPFVIMDDIQTKIYEAMGIPKNCF